MVRKEKKFFKIASLCYTLVYSVLIFFLMAMTYASLKLKSETILAVRQDWMKQPYANF
jgi:hypothetical protein